MNKVLLSLMLTGAALSLGGCAYDQPYQDQPVAYGHPYGYAPNYRPAPAYVPPAYPTSEFVDARVVSVTPTYQSVQVARPRQECYQGQADNTGNHVVGTVAGGLIGGLAGHQFGRGSGNAAATALGAVAGVVGGNVIANQYDQGSVTQCRQVNDYIQQTESDGYEVAYSYNGRVYHTHSIERPGSTIRVRVDVAPQ